MSAFGKLVLIAVVGSAAGWVGLAKTNCSITA